MLIDSEGFGFSTNIQDYLASTPNILDHVELDVALGTNGPLGDNFLNLTMLQYKIQSPVWRRDFPGGTLGTVITGQRFNLSLVNFEGWGVFLVDAAGAVQIGIRIDPYLKTVAAYLGGTGTLLGTSAHDVLPRTGWFYLEVKATIASGTGGSVVVRINNAVGLSVAGANTQATSNAGVVGMQWTYLSPANSYVPDTLQIAHYYCCDMSGPAPGNDFLGDVRVQTLLPIADEAVQFTPNGKDANWKNAATAPPLPLVDFNSDSTPGHQDLFGMAPVAAGLGTVFGVNLKTLLAKSDAGPRTMADVLKSGASVTAGAPVSLGTTPTQYRRILQTDPATSQAWTQAAVDAIKAGYRIVS